MFIKDRIKTYNIIILSSGTEPNEDIGAAELDRRDRDKGCVMIGCHYIIRRDGMVETGRELDKLGHYKRKYNKDSVYVCLIGKEGNFTESQKLVLEDIKDELRDLYPRAQVLYLAEGD